MKLIGLIRAHKVMTATTVIVIAVILLYAFSRGGEELPYEFVIAERGSISQEVSVNGKVKASENVVLAFERSGKIVSVSKDVGDRVAIGTEIIRIDSSELSAQLREAEANVDAQKAKLDELRRETNGSTSAKEYVGTIELLNDSYTKADNAVRIQTVTILTGSQDSGYTFIFDCNENVSLRADVAHNRKRVGDVLVSWRNELDKLEDDSSRQEFDIALSMAQQYLSVFRGFLNGYVELVNECWTTKSVYSEVVTNLNAGSASINTALTNITNKKQSILSQGSSISGQEALVRQAEASADAIKVQISKTTLRSPINGIVTKQDASVGQIISANSAIAEVISDKKLEVETNIPEADIAKVDVGDSVKIDLDAYGRDEIFEARVVKIDPAETIVEGVSTYKASIEFLKDDDRIKPGMTANIDILSDSLENVIAVPQRAVIRDGSRKFVRILQGENYSEVDVETGLIGSDGRVEIISGVQEGDRVITFLEE